jgi:hypothetical protein
MNIIENTQFFFGEVYLNIKVWLRKRCGIKSKADEFLEDPVKAEWYFYRLRKRKSYDNKKILSPEQIDEILKDL